MTFLQRRLVRLEDRFPVASPSEEHVSLQLRALVTLPGAELQTLLAAGLRQSPILPINAAEHAAMDHYREALVGVSRELNIPLADSGRERTRV